MLHGFWGDPQDWQATLATLPPAQAATACCLRLPGHGPKPPPVPADFAACVAAMAAQIEFVAGAATTLVGYSLGARLALGLAAAQPRRWRRVVLSGAHLGLTEAAARRARQEADGRWAAALRTQPLEEVLQAWRRQPVLASQLRVGQVPPARLAADARRRRAQQGPALAAALQAMSLATMPAYAAVAATLPVELVVGEQDVAFVAQAARLPQAPLLRVPNCGHNLPLEAPRALARAIGGQNVEGRPPPP